MHTKAPVVYALPILLLYFVLYPLLNHYNGRFANTNPNTLVGTYPPSFSLSFFFFFFFGWGVCSLISGPSLARIFNKVTLPV
jgi:hypothetical protein